MEIGNEAWNKRGARIFDSIAPDNLEKSLEMHALTTLLGTEMLGILDP